MRLQNLFSYKSYKISFSPRERIFKERIHGLEQQVDILKDQLTKEMRRRQTFILESSGINNEISELRHNLDQSLQNVNATTDGKTLDRYVFFHLNTHRVILLHTL